MPKRATQVMLSKKEQAGLEQIIKRHKSEQQQVLRASIIVAAAQGHSNVQIARELAVNVDTVRLWRDRWVGLQGIDLETLSIADRLQDAPRPGAPSQDYQRAVLSDCRSRLRSANEVWTPNQPVDRARNC